MEDPVIAAHNMNHDLALIGKWPQKRRMSFNPDPQKQAVELTFSRKRIEIDHPHLFFNGIPVRKVNDHKHLGTMLDSRLSFTPHSKLVISKERKGIGLLKHSSKHLPRHTLSDLHKLFVRPHLGYGDFIYHVPEKSM